MKVTIERMAPSILTPTSPGSTYRYYWRVDQQPTPAADSDQGGVTDGWSTTLANACTAVAAVTEIAGP